jgi:hypothetical protein
MGEKRADILKTWDGYSRLFRASFMVSVGNMDIGVLPIGGHPE